VRAAAFLALTMPVSAPALTDRPGAEDAITAPRGLYPPGVF